MAQPQGSAALAKHARQIAAAIVGEHALTGDAARPIPRDGPSDEAGARGSPLLRQDLDVGQPRVIVDRDVDVLPAGARRALLAVAMHPVPGLVKAPQALDVEMDHVAGRRPLVALHRRRGLDHQPIQPQALQPSTDGRARHAEGASERPRRQAVRFAQLADQRHGGRRRLMRRRAWARRAILEGGQPAVAVALHPLADRPPAHAGGLGRGGVRPALVQDAVDEQLT
jgi:hypothetical protein